MIIISVIFSTVYIILLFWFLKGWLRLSSQKSSIAKPEIKFSIIIPSRNEEVNIINTIDDLLSQNYPSQLFEVIIIDDNSEDNTKKNTLEKLASIITLNKDIRLVSIESNSSFNSGHKKRAIEYGISLSKYEWIVTTDADCRRGENWLRSLNDIIVLNNPVLVSAPVIFRNENSVFQKIQSLEFLSLVGIGAASIGNHNPNLCNGANLAYRKSAFYTVNGFSDNLQLSSGDDEFLLHKISAAYPGKTAFLKNRDAIVQTDALATLKDFVQQRKRWVSKSTKYKNKRIFSILLFVYLFHFMILSTAIISIFLPSAFISFIILFLSKIAAECVLVLPLSSYFGKLRFMPLYPVAAFLYVFYVVFIGLLGNSGSYTWKGRQVN